MSARRVLQKRVRVEGTLVTTDDTIYPWDQSVNGGRMEDALLPVLDFGDGVFTLNVASATVETAGNTVSVDIKTVDSRESLKEGGLDLADGTDTGPSWLVKSFAALSSGTSVSNKWMKHSSIMRDADDGAGTHPMDALLYYSINATGTVGDTWAITFEIFVTLKNPS